MNQAEFKSWWMDFGSKFPSIRDWVDGNGGAQLLSQWRDALGIVEHRDAMEVSARMVRGEENAPRAFERDLTVAHVRTIALRLKAQRMEANHNQKLTTMHGTETVACLQCRDTGRVEVWSPKAMKQAAAGDDPPQWRTCQAACGECSKGEFWNTERAYLNGKRIPPLPLYDQTRMVYFDELLPFAANVASLKEWLADPPKAYPEFDSWNKSPI